MSISPKRLNWIVWSVAPAVLWLSVQAVKRFAADELWAAAGYATMGMIVAVGGLVVRDRARPGWKELAWFLLFACASWAWLLGPTAVVNVAGFIGAVAVQIVLIVRLRRPREPLSESASEPGVQSVIR